MNSSPLPALLAILLSALLPAALSAASAVKLESEAAQAEELGSIAKAQELYGQAGAQRMKDAQLIFVKGEKKDDDLAIGSLEAVNLGEDMDVFDEMSNSKEAIEKAADTKASFYTSGAIDFEKALLMEKADKAFALAEKVPGQSDSGKISLSLAKSESQRLRGEPEASLAEARKALALTEGKEALVAQRRTALSRISSLQMELGDTKAAVEAVFDLVSLTPAGKDRYKPVKGVVDSLTGRRLYDEAAAACRRVFEDGQALPADRLWATMKEAGLLRVQKKYDEALAVAERAFQIQGVRRSEAIYAIFQLRHAFPDSAAAWDWFADTIRESPARWGLEPSQCAGLWSEFGWQAYRHFRPDLAKRALDEVLALKQKPGFYSGLWTRSITAFEQLKTFPRDESEIHFPTNVTDFGVEMKSEAFAKDFNYDEQDATRCIQEAIDSGATTVVIENTGRPWRIDSVRLRSNQNLLLQKGVVILGTEASQKGGLKSPMFSTAGANNVAIIGLGDKPEDVYIGRYPDRKTRLSLCKDEGGSGISISGHNILVKNLKIADNSCDGITLGGAGEVFVQDVILESNYRQACSICNANGFYCKNVDFRDTVGGAPMLGIDLEPTYEIESNANIYLYDCHFENNAGGGLNFSSSTYLPVTLHAKRCTFEPHGNGAVIVFARCGVYMAASAKAPGKILFEDCLIKGEHGSPPIRIMAASFFDVEFRKCTVRAVVPEGKKPAGNPVFFKLDREYHGSPYTRNPDMEGEVLFTDCTAEGYPEDRPLVTFRDLTGNYAITKIRGTMKSNGKVYDMSQYRHDAPDLDREVIAAFDPEKFDPPAKALDPEAPANGPRGFDFKWKVAWFQDPPVYTGIFRDGDGWRLKKLAPYHRLNGVGGKAVAYYAKGYETILRLLAPNPNKPGFTLYFEVPPGGKECVFKANGNADLLNEKGEVVDQCRWDGDRGYYYFTVKPSSEKSEIMALKVHGEGIDLKFFAPFSGIVAEKPEWLPRQKP